MTYLLSQLFLYLVSALLLGLLLGWVIWGWRSRRLIEEAKAEGEQALRAQQQECAAEKSRLQAIIDQQAKAAKEAQPALAAAPEATAAEPVKFATDAPKPASLYATRPTEIDDLKHVKGIGPVMERILNENGCYRFKQLANFSKRDIEWVSATIETMPDRIERDRWVEQAQVLYFEKYGKRHDSNE